jgi:hypothetical protein
MAITTTVATLALERWRGQQSEWLSVVLLAPQLGL